MPLPLSSLDNPYSFPLPYVKESEDIVSGSSSKTTTTSDLSTPVTSSDKVEEAAENVIEETPSTSVKETASPPSLLKNKLRHHSDSDLSDSCSNEPQDNSECSQNGQPQKSSLNMRMQLRGRSSHDSNELVESDSCESSRFTRSFKVKQNIDLALFSKYFPEIAQESKDQEDSLPLNCSSEVLSNSSAELGPKPTPSAPVVVIPTGLQTTNSNVDNLDQSKASESAKTDSKESLVNSTTTFVEEPAPQVLGHISPEKQEPVYVKTLSVDR